MSVDSPAIAVRVDQGQVVLTGAVVLATAARLRAALRAVAEPVTGVDLAAVTTVDSAGMAVLCRWLEAVEAGGDALAVSGQQRALRLLALLRQARPEAGDGRPAAGVFARIGAAAAGLALGLRSMLVVLGAYSEAHLRAVLRPASVAWRDVSLLVQRAGADGMLIVMLTNVLVGAIMGFLGVVQLQKFGAAAYVPDMVAIGHLRELGPIMTAIIVAGRSGAGFAAELGTMTVSEECDALRTLGLDPLRWLVIPRELALLIALPLLTVIGNLCGLIGGGIAAVGMSEITVPFYIDATIRSATVGHVAIGMAKSVVFAVAIAWIACAQGLAARGGAAAVGVRTTAAVVSSIFAVIVIDAVFALVTTVLGL